MKTMITYSTFLFFVSVLVAVGFAIYLYTMLKLRKAKTGEFLCPSCKETLGLETTLKPLEITYRCANPNCALSGTHTKEHNKTEENHSHDD